MVIIRNREDITYYGRVRFGDKGKNCLEKQQAFFDESVSEYKNTMKHFCFECMVRLLRLFSCDLNRITHDCIVLRKKMKNNRCYCSIHCLFPLFDSSSSEYKASISAFFGHFLQLFFCWVCTGEYICIHFIRRCQFDIEREQVLFLTNLSQFKPSVVGISLHPSPSILSDGNETDWWHI